MPRNEEIFYENNLMNNKKKFWKASKAKHFSNDYNAYHHHGKINDLDLKSVQGLVDHGKKGNMQFHNCKTNLEKAEHSFK